MNSRKKAIKVAVGLGVIAGMRSMAAPALLSHYLTQRPQQGLVHSKLNFLRSPIFSKIAKVLAAGEMAGDKAPQIPDRIKPVSLAGRAASGALVGATAFIFNKEKAWQGLLIGGAAAVASTFITFYLRKNAGKSTNLNDKIVGTVEDAIVIGSGMAVAKSM